MPAPGMTLLHHSARAGYEKYVEIVINGHADLANYLTFDHGVPAKWLPVHCLADNPKPPTSLGGKSHAKMLLAIASNTRPELLVAKTGVNDNGSTVAHMLVSRGHKESLSALLELLWNKLGPDAVSLDHYAIF